MFLEMPLEYHDEPFLGLASLAAHDVNGKGMISATRHATLTKHFASESQVRIPNNRYTVDSF